MARVNGKSKRGTAKPLVLDLAAPGMTALLRAGLGGLAAALRSILLAKDRDAVWPSPVRVGRGVAHVEARRIVLDWQGHSPADVLKALFHSVFGVSRLGIIDLVGTYEPWSPPSTPLAIALQSGLKRTFLQHGKTTVKAGAPRTAQEEVDDGRFTFTWQPYKSFVHQEAWKEIEKARTKGSVELAGWAYPGASQRHIQYSATKCEYGAAEALCGCFALVGCLSFEVRPGSMGALVIPEPSDIVEYAVVRPRLTPARPADAYVSSVGDAVLQTELAMKMDELARRHGGIGAMHGVLLKPLPWATQQKSRSRTVSVESVSESRLDLYFRLSRALPARLRTTGAEGDESGEGGYFVATSALRAFAADNLAKGLPWHHGFATATTEGKARRYLHYYRDRDGLGALYLEEKKGLIVMLDQLDDAPDLDDAEKALVRSVHEALRQRFGRIYDETKDLPEATRRNRFENERERWRHAFASAKTLDQVRAALANLWSQAGSNRELRASWEKILPLLRPTSWQLTRDLALVALASYQGAGRASDASDEMSA